MCSSLAKVRVDLLVQSQYSNNIMQLSGLRQIVETPKIMKGLGRRFDHLIIK